MSRTSRHSKLGVTYRSLATFIGPLMGTVSKHDWQGLENLAGDTGAVIAVNHISWADPFVVAQFMWQNDRPPRFLGKDGVFHIPVAGKLLTNAGQIPVYRDGDAAQAARAAIEAARNGETVVVYPEGTITRDPDMWPMCGKTGAVRIALEAGVPLIPVAQWGAQEILAPYDKKLRLFPLKTTAFRVGPPIDLDDLRVGKPSGAQINEATNRLMEVIASMLGEIRGEQPPPGCWDRSSETRRTSETGEEN